jgi:nitroreductase
MLKLKFINFLRFVRNFLVLVCSKNRLFARLFFFISGDFDREFESTLKGRHDALTHKYTFSNSNANIRRAIHRLEKGLFHANPRNKFGKDVFEELSKELVKYDLSNIELNELHWLKETLISYERFSYNPERVRKTLHLVDAELRLTSPPKILDKTVSPDFESYKSFLNRRKSVRFFKQEPPSLEKITQCVEVAKSAPTACNRQPYHVELLTNKQDIKKIGEMAPGTAGWLDNIPTLGVVVGHSNSFRFTRDRHLIYFDSGLFVSNFVNALAVSGLASCICNWVPNWKEDRKAIKYLGYDLSKTVVCLIAIGVPLGIKSPVSVKKTTSNILRVRDED